MKIRVKTLIFFTILTFPIIAEEKNILKGACGYVALSTEHIKGLYVEIEPGEIYLGDDQFQGKAKSDVAIRNFGVIFDDSSSFSENPSLSHLSDVSFDHEESKSKKI